MMRKPNFFIIGAPKCGTTSWASWLAEHPQVYFSPLKEPHFFGADVEHKARPTPKQYEALFRPATAQHQAIGEGSTSYLASRTAVPDIEAYTGGQAKYIVCLRTPVEIAPSSYAQQCADLGQKLGNFEELWRQNARFAADAGNSARYSPFAGLFEFWRIGAQLRRLYERVPRARVFVILLDDVRADPRGVYLSVLDFLGVDDDGRTDFPVENGFKIVRSSLLARLPHVLAAAKAKSGINTNFGIGVGRFIHKLNYKFLDKPRLSPELRAEMQDYFRDDILLLQELLGRDLSHWLAPMAPPQVGVAD